MESESHLIEVSSTETNDILHFLVDTRTVLVRREGEREGEGEEGTGGERVRCRVEGKM